MLVVDPEAIHAAREALRADLGEELRALWRDAYAATAANRFETSPSAKGARRLRTVALAYLMAGGADDAAAMAMAQFEGADNMTDRQGALGILSNSDAGERTAALDAFYRRYRINALVLDKWFSVQALSTRDDTNLKSAVAGKSRAVSVVLGELRLITTEPTDDADEHNTRIQRQREL